MLILTHTITPTTTLYIWRIEESFEDLFDQVYLTDANMVRVMSMKSQQHQRGFLAVRMLFKEAGYSDANVTYSQTGKPRLSDGKHITISHSHELAAIIVSGRNVGLDLEMIREKIIRIADKFTSNVEQEKLDPESGSYVSQLTMLWGVKESIFKIRDEIGISFKDHITTFAWDMETRKARAVLDFEGQQRYYQVQFFPVGPYMVVYAIDEDDL
ncbi:MAG: 4'-phosphopantetheinyl transferase superfamily protein [Chitinophagaceae bacterium]|nr:MAG: 4'-phosphopantetheinyl transferase superfamily protein [Chitinophagaceae bacterium]